MIAYVRSTGITVSDQDKAIDFYVNKLGFELRSDLPMGEGMRWVEVAPPGAQTLLILMKGYGETEGRLGKFANIVFEADDIQATYETLKDRGVHFTEPPTSQSWGRKQALFVDQDGNGFVLVGQ